MKTLMQLPPELGDLVEEFHQRFGRALADPDPATIGVRAEAAFGDHEPAWPLSPFQSVDVQIASRGEAALAAGDYLAVVGDVHLGNNPLIQGVFAHRHADPAALLSRVTATAGPGMPVMLPPWSPTMALTRVACRAPPTTWCTSRSCPRPARRAARRTWHPTELQVDGADLVDRTGELRVPLVDAFWLPIFVSGMRVFSLLPEEDHSPRVTVGGTVLRREGWSIRAGEIPDRAEDVPAFARDRGMPRRLFTKSPLERKPMYLDTDSAVLSRILLSPGPPRRR